MHYETSIHLCGGASVERGREIWQLFPTLLVPRSEHVSLVALAVQDWAENNSNCLFPMSPKFHK